ncbi:hypothetical protein Ae201684P_015614 [Aphanomyces euteiches]|nr:hypothetical protein Ae201684P_015614 [Aphanomyces euteiches]
MPSRRSWWTNPVLRQVVLGTYDDASPLAWLRGCSHILEMIFHRLLDAWRAHVNSKRPGYVRLQWVPFPLTTLIDGEPQPFHVNMMPFIMGDPMALPQSCRRLVEGLTLSTDFASHWGGGYLTGNILHGGIFMASTAANSCSVWNVYVDDSHQVRGPFGDVEHLRSVLDENVHGYRELEANELIWMTDATPHESLPVRERTFRQFFRLVTNNLTY